MYMEEIVSNDLKENLKVFWSYVKSKRQESTGVSPLKNNIAFIHSDMHSSSKVEILNDKFVFAYTREDKLRNRAKIRNRYNQAPHLIQDTNGKVTTSQYTQKKEQATILLWIQSYCIETAFSSSSETPRYT